MSPGAIGCGMELDQVDVGGGGGGMKVDKMGFEGRTKGSMWKWRRWIADDMASEDMESNTGGGHLGRKLAAVGVLEELGMVADGTAVVAVVVVIVVASVELRGSIRFARKEGGTGRKICTFNVGE